MTRPLQCGYIGRGLRAVGTLAGEVDMQIEGRFEGDLRIAGRAEIGILGAADGQPHGTGTETMTRPSILPTGAAFIGAIDGDGDVVVLGSFEGNVSIRGALVIEQSGAVRGEVRARTVTVRGMLEGPGTADEWIAVEEGATAFGDLTAPRIRIVEGARFRGRLSMEGGPRSLDEEPATVVMRRSAPPEPVDRPPAKAPPLRMPVPKGASGRFRS